MTKEIKKKSATTVMKEIIDAKQAASSTKEQQKLNVGKFERYLKENNISDTWESMNLNLLLLQLFLTLHLDWSCLVYNISVRCFDI